MNTANPAPLLFCSHICFQSKHLIRHSQFPLFTRASDFDLSLTGQLTGRVIQH